MHTHHGERVAEQKAQLQKDLPPHVARELHHPTEPAGRQASAPTATRRTSSVRGSAVSRKPASHKDAPRDEAQPLLGGRLS